MSDKEPLLMFGKYFFKHDDAHVHNEYVAHLIIEFSTPLLVRQHVKKSKLSKK